MTVANDVVDRNGMKHDDDGLFSGYSGSSHHHHLVHSHSTSKAHLPSHSIPHSSSSSSDIAFHKLLSKIGGIGGGHSSSHNSGGHSPHIPQLPKQVFRLPLVKTNGPAKQTWRYVDKNGVEQKTRIDRMTGRPISQAYEDAINKLYRGEDISMDEIEKIPEISKESDFAHAFCALDPFLHPEDYEHKREKLDDIYKRFSDDTITPATNESLNEGESYQVEKGKEIWLVTGLPGSGKSTQFVGPISKDHKARVVDSDAIKEQMPGFCNGLGAPNVHEESKVINDRILSESLKRGDNIVYPVLGYNAEYVGGQIDTFRRHGYRVHLLLNELPFSQSLARCLERRLATGRNIPLAMFKKVGDRPSEAYETLKKKVDTFEKHSGDGIKTSLVEKGENKDLPPPHQSATYSYQGQPLGNFQPQVISQTGDISFPQHTKDPKWHTTFHVKQKKPTYWPKSWFGDLGKDSAMDADDNSDIQIDRFGNVELDSIITRTTYGDRPKMTAIPDAFDDEIEGNETANDLARFHYLMSGEDSDC